MLAGECPDWMRSFGDLHGIEVTGRLDDIGAVLDGRSVVIAPIRAGSGTIVEVIDAWARGIPVVATSRGVEGLEPHDGDDVLVADDPAEFAARCSMAARYPALRDRLAATVGLGTRPSSRGRGSVPISWPGSPSNPSCTDARALPTQCRSGAICRTRPTQRRRGDSFLARVRQSAGLVQDLRNRARGAGDWCDGALQAGSASRS